MNGGGDSLARGARSAVFGPPNVSQEKWDECFGTVYTVPLHVEVPEGTKVTTYKIKKENK